MENFNNNDEAFLWYLLYLFLNGNTIDHTVPEPYIHIKSDINLEDNALIGTHYRRKRISGPVRSTNELNKYIVNKFDSTDTLQKIVGFIRVYEFGMDIAEYINAWDEIKKYGDDQVIFDINNNLLEFKTFDNFNLFEVKISKNYDFEIFEKVDVYGQVLWQEMYTHCYLFKYDDKFYVGKFKSVIKIINDVVNMNKQSSVRKWQLSKILPYINGNIEYVKSYDGSIVNGRYVTKDYYESFPIISKHELKDIVEKYE